MVVIDVPRVITDLLVAEVAIAVCLFDDRMS
jgi:hypothetical protein